MYLTDIDIATDDDWDVNCFPHPFLMELRWVHETNLLFLRRRLLRRNERFWIGTWCKIIIHFSERTKVRALDVNAPVTTINWPFKFDDYAAKNDREKAALLMRTTCDALTWYAKEHGRSPKVFSDAYADAVATDFVFRSWTKKSYPTRDRRFAVKVYAEIHPSRVDMWAVLYRNRGRQELGRKLMSAPPRGIVNIFDLFRNVRWVRGVRFEVLSGHWNDRYHVNLGEFMKKP